MNKYIVNIYKLSKPTKSQDTGIGNGETTIAEKVRKNGRLE